MNIQDAMSSGISGFQRASNQADQAAANIASGVAVTPQSGNTVNMTDEVVNLKIAEQAGLASGEAIKTADEMMGTLIDIRV